MSDSNVKGMAECTERDRSELKRRDGSRVHIMIHKLIMKVFNYIPGCENLEVNHIDGNKHNNALWNLEWVTHQENMDHAKLNNLVKSGEQASMATLTEAQVREICEILKSERYVNQYGDIAAKYNIAPVTVLEIANGTTWTSVSCDYDLDYSFRLNDRFSKEDVHKMCQIMQKYGCLDDKVYQHIFKELGIEHPTHNIKVRIKRIYDRNPGYFYKISSQYNW